MMLSSIVVVFFIFSTVNGAGDVVDKWSKYIDDYKFGIFPGTKWCGNGDVATNNELGSLPVTDACCRAHDKCSPKIKGHKSYKNLFNIWPYTRLHCHCDTAFHSCLKQAESKEKEAQIVGRIFFDVLKAKCFKTVVKRKCVKIATSWSRPYIRCVTYKTENTLAFVDTPVYLS